MRAVLQRVSRASVKVDGIPVGEIGPGILALVGIGTGDSEADARQLAEKTAHLRIFDDPEGKMNLSVLDVGGSVLAVSQFTLFGDVRKGRRPGFTEAAAPEMARDLFEYFVLSLRQLGIFTPTCQFQADMFVELVNDGPVTILVDTEKRF